MARTELRKDWEARVVDLGLAARAHRYGVRPTT